MNENDKSLFWIIYFKLNVSILGLKIVAGINLFAPISGTICDLFQNLCKGKVLYKKKDVWTQFFWKIKFWGKLTQIDPFQAQNWSIYTYLWN